MRFNSIVSLSMAMFLMGACVTTNDNKYGLEDAYLNTDEDYSIVGSGESSNLNGSIPQVPFSDFAEENNSQRTAQGFYIFQGK